MRDCVHDQGPTSKLKRSYLHDGGGGGDCILQSISFTRLGNPVLLMNRFSTSRPRGSLAPPHLPFKEHPDTNCIHFLIAERATDDYHGIHRSNRILTILISNSNPRNRIIERMLWDIKLEKGWPQSDSCGKTFVHVSWGH